MVDVRSVVSLERGRLEVSRADMSNVRRVSREFCDIFRKRGSGGKVSFSVLLGGSIAKGTWIPGRLDVDVFFCFASRHRGDDLSKLLEVELRRRKLKFRRIHGSRDYFKVVYEGFSFELVPILRTSRVSDIENITDATPYHVKWVNSKSKGIKEEIKLFKRFCQGLKVYGAESHIGGFSGYVCEVLVVRNKSFVRTLREVSSWRVSSKKIVVDVERYYRGGNVLRFFNKSKVQNPLVVVDPVDKFRNASAAVSEKSLRKLIRACRDFLRRPSSDYFLSKRVTKESLVKGLKRDEELVVLRIVPRVGKRDVVGSRSLKVIDFFKRELKSLMFDVVSSDYDHENFLGWIVTKKVRSRTYEHRGPSVKDKKNVGVFRRKYKGVKVRRGFLFVVCRRRFLSSVKACESLVGDGYLKGKVKGVSVL